jgi:hypothetical protein
LKKYTKTFAKKNHGDLNAASEWITHAEDLDPEEEPTSENGKETTTVYLDLVHCKAGPCENGISNSSNEIRIHLLGV